MKTIQISAIFAGLLLVGLLACLHIGWRISRRRMQNAGNNSHAGLGALAGAQLSGSVSERFALDHPTA